MSKFIKENSLIILVCASLVFLLVFGLIQNIKGASGTWSSKINQHPRNITKGGFESKGEARTRAFLETYFRQPFGKVRPNFLNNDVTGGRFNMEIDCYNENLKLGVEYNGRQHYEYTPHFHPTKDAFYNQKYRDKLKRIYCNERGITLIEIPYTEKNIENWLQNELEARGYKAVL